MKARAPGSFGAQLRALRDAAGFTQEELATIAGLSVHAVSALERGERRRPQAETVRALCTALDLTGSTRDALLAIARGPARTAFDELNGFSIPLPLTVLLGRDRDMQSLQQWLADPAARMITLIGPGGVGKTRLALELALAVAEARSHRVLFVPLAAIENPAFVASAIAEALGLADVTEFDLPRRARTACDDQPTLMVLDNFEQVLDAAPLVAELLTAAASLRLLVTSRAPLRVRGEREYVVGPLELTADSGADSPADLTRAPAVRLFVQRVRDVQPNFHLTSSNAPTVTAICRHLDALPLALELAAPWIKVLTAETLLHRLEDDVLISSVAPRDLPERQQTMNATVAWSYQLLDPDEQRAFRRFAVLPGLFPIDAAAAVLAGREDSPSAGDDALRAAAGLMNKSLLVRAETSAVPTCPLYYMLETVRAYAGRKLHDAGEHDDAMEGLVRYTTRAANLAAEGLVGPAQVEWLDRVREDLESYRSALAWLLERHRTIEASDIAWGLMFYWLIRGHAAEGLRWYEQILDLPSLPPAAESKAVSGASVMWYTRGDIERARTAGSRALALAQSTGDPRMAALAENLLGHIDRALGNVDSARDRFARSIEGFQALSMPWGRGNALSGIAGIAIATGEIGRADRLLDEATAVLQDAGPWFLMPVLYVRAILAVRRGNPDEAIGLVRENLTRIRKLHDKFAFVYALAPLAAAAVLKGDDEWGARILGVRDTVIERTGLRVIDTPVRDLRDRAERDARERLGPTRWAEAYAAGRRICIDSAHDLYRFVAEGDR
jgi:predicted ATPase/transcriptional regulator with XRE-family HTH domain